MRGKGIEHGAWRIAHSVKAGTGCGYIASSTLRVAGRGLRSCEVRGTGCEVRVFDCGLRIADCKLTKPDRVQ